MGGGALTTALQASADVRLPPRSAAQLLVDLQTARLDGVSGTVVERADLGLPALPANLGGANGTDLTSLITGSNTMRVWYSGKDKARVALIRAMGESDVIHNGTDTWVWNSRENTAVHYRQDANGTHAARPEATPTGLPSDLPKTPQELADRVLAALDPTTAVSTDSNAIVAGHKAYQLVLRPRDAASLIAEVRIAIDGTAHVPTRAQVFAKGSLDKAAFEIGFTQVSFKRPDDGVFAFNPPPGAKVTEADQAGKAAAGPNGATKPTAPTEPARDSKTAVIGKGWTAVLVTRLPQSSTAPKAGGTDRGQAGALAFLGTLPQVHGPFGTGRVLTTRLFTALLLDDGRVLVGAVDQDRLTAAANDPAAAIK
jgi:outer membrane lipoprotein-sorting protein